MTREAARAIHRLLIALSIGFGAAVTTIAANGIDVPLWLQIANAVTASLAAGQLLPRPTRDDAEAGNDVAGTRQ